MSHVADNDKRRDLERDVVELRDAIGLDEHEIRAVGRYADLFDTVEISQSSYRLPSVATMDAWAARAPAGFVYSLKVGQYGSHRKKLREPTGWIANHVDRAARLGAHLGPNLVQLPPRWHRDTGRLDEFLAAAPAELLWSVELRDPSWLHDDVFAVLERHRAALCIHDLIADHPWLRTAPGWVYLRFHGPHADDARYAGRYGRSRLERIADRLAPWLDDGTDVYGYFNNDTNAAAVHDAVWLRARLTNEELRPAAGQKER